MVIAWNLRGATRQAGTPAGPAGPRTRIQLLPALVRPEHWRRPQYVLFQPARAITPDTLYAVQVALIHTRVRASRAGAAPDPYLETRRPGPRTNFPPALPPGARGCRREPARHPGRSSRSLPRRRARDR